LLWALEGKGIIRYDAFFLFEVRMKILLQTLFAILVGSVAGASEVSFYCSTEEWIDSPSDLQVFAKTVSCMKENAFWSVEEKAQERCNRIAAQFKIPQFKAQFLPEQSCHFESQQISDKLAEEHINRLDFGDLWVEKTSLEMFVDNRGNETALIRADGSEQAQWIHREDGIYCGFPGKGLALKMDEGQSVTILDMNTDTFAEFEFIASNALSNTYRRVSGDLQTPEFFEQSTSMGHLGFAIYDGAVGSRTNQQLIRLAYLDRENQRVCSAGAVNAQ
jgi:hypothetical protein